MSNRYIGSGCYISYTSKAALVRADDSLRIPLTPTEYRILTIFANHVGKPLSLDNLADVLWGCNYAADKKDPKSIKPHISRIKQKLSQISTDLHERLQTNIGYGTYTFHADPLFSEHDQDDEKDNEKNDEIDRRLVNFIREIDRLTEKLEKLQEKLNRARQNNDSVWEAIYASQFQMYFSLIMSLQKEANEKCMLARDLFHQLHEPVFTSADTIASLPDPKEAVQAELPHLQSWINSSSALADRIADQLDAAIYEYMSSDSCTAEFLTELLNELPPSRSTAQALLQLTSSFDGLLELYEALFGRYAAYLTDTELAQLFAQAQSVWDPVIWKQWEE